MKFKIPFTFSDVEILKRRSEFFVKLAGKKETKIDGYLKATGEKINKRQYLSICYRSFLLNLLVFSVVASSVLGLLNASNFYLYGLGTSLLISGFILINQINYPRIFSMKKARDIEKNLIGAMKDMMVQLNSGVPLFRILFNISESDYGEVSEEFKKITKEINSGASQIETIEKYGKLNTSEYFRRVLWQISNSMRAGGDMGVVIGEGIKNLNAEQEIQIQSYGSKLNPLVVFYMLIAVILPSLGITFLIIISSILNIQDSIIRVVFFLVFGFVVFIQIMFLGLIKSKRPSLL